MLNHFTTATVSAEATQRVGACLRRAGIGARPPHMHAHKPYGRAAGTGRRQRLQGFIRDTVCLLAPRSKATIPPLHTPRAQSRGVHGRSEGSSLAIGCPPPTLNSAEGVILPVLLV